MLSAREHGEAPVYTPPSLSLGGSGDVSGLHNISQPAIPLRSAYQSIFFAIRYRFAIVLRSHLPQGDIDREQRQRVVIRTLLTHEAKKEQTQVNYGTIHHRRPRDPRTIRAQAWARNGAGDSSGHPSIGTLGEHPSREKVNRRRFFFSGECGRGLNRYC